MDYGEAASDDHLNIDDNDLPFEFASNGSGCKLPEPCPTTSRVDSSSEDQQRFPGSAQSKGDVNENEHSQSPSRSAHPVYMYVSRTTTEWTCKTCERCFKGPRLFNITRHFKRSHPEIFSEIEALRLQMNPDDVANYLVPLISAATNGIVSSPGVSISSTGSVTKQSLYETHKTSSKQPTKKMKAGNVVSSVDFAQKQIASIVSSGILQPSTFENEEVRRLLSLIPGFTVPNKKAIENLVENDVMTTFSMISQILESTSQMSLMALSVDVQLQEGSHPGFIAVFGHYYDVRAKTFERILIDIADFPDRPPKNSVDGAINEILSKFASRLSLDNHKISRTTVLEVPRLVPAYRKPFINLFTEQDGNQRELEESDYCTVSCCPERLSVIPNCAEKGIQMEKEGLRDKKLSAWIKTSESSKHVSCAAQLMQEVMANVFQEDVEMIKAVKSMTDIFKKITSSVDVVKQLMERTNGNELRIPSSNRWCSVLGSIDVFLTMKSQIEAVCKANRWDFLSEDKLDLISKVTTITNPILRFSERLQAVDSPTVSLLLPGLIKLIEHLKKSGMEISSHYASKLITEVEKLFAHVLHSGEPGYDPIYLVSTLLDRRVAHMVAEYYDTKQQRTIIMNTISQMFPELREKCETSGSEIVLEDSSPFGFGTIASSISVPSATSLEGSELVPYFHRFIRLPTSSSSIEFWMENEHDFPILSKVAVSILSIPASTIQLQPTLTAINERVAKQLQEVQGTKLPKWLRSNIFLAFNEHLTKGEPAPDGLSGNCSDTSCSPLLSKDPPNKASKNRTKFVAVKMECDSNDESSFTPMKEETMLEPASKIRKKHNEERRHSTASSTSSKSSVNGCL
ncbi:hypothetical protein L596_014820 [Steinernema carpocapsae]|uniref:HAT C-terminal dimerisation domain-containing protein n=1 Tax=Steinernema carpocapsae TaxID=34508 RepID=A0A4U5NDL2_STECR|nr:hypothetical protein L596_014820 [Steinernema carpocapsae]